MKQAKVSKETIKTRKYLSKVCAKIEKEEH
jgi:hypothetical protein